MLPLWRFCFQRRPCSEGLVLRLQSIFWVGGMQSSIDKLGFLIFCRNLTELSNSAFVESEPFSPTLLVVSSGLDSCFSGQYMVGCWPHQSSSQTSWIRISHRCFRLVSKTQVGNDLCSWMYLTLRARPQVQVLLFRCPVPHGPCSDDLHFFSLALSHQFFLSLLFRLCL